MVGDPLLAGESFLAGDPFLAGESFTTGDPWTATARTTAPRMARNCLENIVVCVGEGRELWGVLETLREGAEG